MSYQVLARKWRPRAFHEMAGQEHVLQALINALDNERLHHAYLFTGTRGVGKTTIARILAKCLNCEQGISSKPCDSCGACAEIGEGRFVDLIEVDAASRTKVEDTRELLENVQYAPTRGRYKVYLIDEVHMLSTHSFNALLKTLEEPPPHVKFLLATTDPQKLPVTILSRCLQFNLKNLSPERITEHLKYVLGQESVPFEESALWALARSADGSMRDALSLTDQAIAHGAGKVTEAEVNAMLGTIDRSWVIDLCRAVGGGDGQEALAVVERMAEHAPDFNAVLGDMLGLWHRVAIAQSVPDALDNRHGDYRQVLELANQISREDVQLCYQIALLGRRDLPMAPDPRSGFEMVLLRQLAFKPGSGEMRPPIAGEATPVKKPQPTPAEPTPVRSATPAVEPHQSAPASIESPPLTPASAPPEPAATPEPLTSRAAGAAEALAAIEDDRPTLAPPEPAPPQPTPDKTPLAAGRQPSAPEAVAPTALVAQPPAARPVDSAPAPSPSSASPPSPSPAAPGDVPADSWIAICHQLALAGVLGNTVANLEIVECSDQGYRFVLDRSQSSLYEESQQQRLADALSDHFGKPLQVEIRIGEVTGVTPRLYGERQRAERLQAAVESIRNDPLVQDLQQMFDGRLLEESVQPID